jgi:hypothetical protein
MSHLKALQDIPYLIFQFKMIPFFIFGPKVGSLVSTKYIRRWAEKAFVSMCGAFHGLAKTKRPKMLCPNGVAPLAMPRWWHTVLKIQQADKIP